MTPLPQGRGLQGLNMQSKGFKRVAYVTLISAAIAAAIGGKDKIAEIAKSFVGKEEKTNNSGFKDPEFEKAMEAEGWQHGYSWCVYFVKLVWDKSLQNDTVRKAAMKLISGNSQATLANFKADKSGLFTVSSKPTIGAIVIFQEFKSGVGQYTGHAGIVTSVLPDGFETIEGNTNTTGGREGYIVAKKKRKLIFDSKGKSGLILKAFITVKTLN